MITREAGLNLDHSAITSAEEQYSFVAKAFETKRIYLKDLDPNSILHVIITAEDLAGNIIETPVSEEFKTLSLKAPNILRGEPSPMKEGVYWTFHPEGIDDHCHLEIIDAPKWLSVSEDKSFIEGVPLWKKDQNQVIFNLKLKGEGCDDEAEYKASIKGDPLYQYAWHMNPKTDQFFSWHASPDHKFKSIYTKQLGLLTGAGIKVAVIDSGLQTNHPDLVKNLDRNASNELKNFINIEPEILGGNCSACEYNDTTPSLEEGQPGDQGTSIAGIIAAEAWNNIGSRGIAPNATLGAYNLTSPRITDRISNIDYTRIMNEFLDYEYHLPLRSVRRIHSNGST